MDKALAYYTKGLSIEVRQKLFYHLNREISRTTIKYFLEKEDGYPSFRSMGFSDNDIRLVCDSYFEKFEHANQMMAECSRPPLYSNPHDSFQSAQEHIELLKDRSKEELVEMFGCTYEEYVPIELPKT